jgi:thiol-disulfide isomerase/thioredoxin
MKPTTKSLRLSSGRAALLLVAAVASATVGCGNRADASPGPAPARTPTSTSAGELRTLDSDAIQREMKSARGRTLFVHLWASWCGPCIEELPLIDRFARAARARGAVVLSISLDTAAWAIGRVPIVLRARAPSLTAIVARYDDPDRFISLFSKSWEGAIPAMFVFDRSGKLERSLIGEMGRAELDALVAELPPPSSVGPR